MPQTASSTLQEPAATASSAGPPLWLPGARPEAASHATQVAALARQATATAVSSDGDVARIKTDLAAEFKKVFTTELQERGGYQVVDKAGADVLVLRPALLNVEVNAPDIMSPGINATVVRSAGQMTLFLELWDSATNTLLARVMDAQADNDTFGKAANRATNKQAADEILRGWAHELRIRLDEIKGKTPG